MKIILTGILTLMLAGCSEDFLDLSDPASLTTTTYFTSPADFETAVNGIYAQLRGFHGSGSPTPFLEVGSMHSDEARYYLNPELRANLRSEYYCDFVADVNQYTDFWNTFYGWISRANDVISRIDDVEFDDSSEKDNLKGQALFVRAYAYWWCLRLYGQAVLRIEPVSSLDQTSSPLVSEAEVKAQVLSDAALAASLLPVKPAVQDGHITSGAANMLLGDVHMWYSEFAEAQAAYEELLNDGYALETNYADVFDVTNLNNDESVWEIQYLSPDYSNGIMNSTYPSPASAEDVFAVNGASDAAGSTGQHWLAPTPDLIANFVANSDTVQDERYAKTILWTHYNYGWVPMENKWVHKIAFTNSPLNNFIVYRYAETLLSLAEAINEQSGGAAAAVVYLDQILNRAGMPSYSGTVDQANVRAAIRVQRQLELALEGKRWWDMVRWDNYQSGNTGVDLSGVGKDIIVAYGANVNANPPTSWEQYYFNGGTHPAAGNFTDFRTIFNLPTDETLYNQDL